MTVMQDAGILSGDRLTDAAKQKFIKEVKDELELGTERAPASPFPCGPSIPPMRDARLLQLEDESKFSGFHSNVLGQYASIASALDSESRFTMLPVCDPVALAGALGVDPPRLKFPDEFIVYGFNPALLAPKLGFKLSSDLLAKLPALLSLPIPAISLQGKSIDPKKFPELLAFSSALSGIPPKLPNVLIEMLPKMPQLIAGVLSFDLKPFCDAVVSAKLFGDFGPEASTWLAAQKVLARKTAECALLNLVGTTVGSAAGGIVGGLGSFLGYGPTSL